MTQKRRHSEVLSALGPDDFPRRMKSRHGKYWDMTWPVWEEAWGMVRNRTYNTMMDGSGEKRWQTQDVDEDHATLDEAIAAVLSYPYVETYLEKARRARHANTVKADRARENLAKARQIKDRVKAEKRRAVRGRVLAKAMEAVDLFGEANLTLPDPSADVLKNLYDRFNSVASSLRSLHQQQKLKEDYGDNLQA